MAFPKWGGIWPLPRLFLYVTAAFRLPAIYLGLVRRPRRPLVDIALASLYLVVSAYAVLQPGGPFAHYLNLLSQPYFLLCMLVSAAR